MYKYYVEINSKEHMLNSYELSKLYNINTPKGKPHARFVNRLLKEYCAIAGIQERFYYKTSKGMMLVWPSSIYKPILDKLLEDYSHNEIVAMEFSNKTHNFIIGECI